MLKNNLKIAVVIFFSLAFLITAGERFLSDRADAASFETITWSERKLNVALPIGSTITKTLTFKSNQSQRSINLKAVPEISNFVTISPSAFENVPANTPQTVTVTFTAPEQSGVGVFEGTIHVNKGKKTIPIPLSVSITVEEAGEQVIASTEGTISPGYGRIELPNVAGIEMTANPNRPQQTYLLEQWAAPRDTQMFLNYLASENLPAITENKYIKISTEQVFPGFMGIKAKVPDEVRNSLPPNFVPELYVELVNVGADDEELGEWFPLQAEFNDQTGELSAALSTKHFASLNTPAAPLNAGQAESLATISVSARIRVSVANQLTRTLPITGTFTTPSSGMTEATVRQTIMLSGNLEVKAPVSLVSPTATNFVTSPFGPTHNGVDLRAANGDPISAAADGTVIFVGNQAPTGRNNRLGQPQSGGFAIRIQHADGSVTGYAHLVENSNTVSEGDTVNAGQQIAQGDSTGGVSGPHLHLTYTVDGTRVNPQTFIGADDLPQEYLNQLSIIASVDGTPVEATRKRVTQREFTYSAPLDIAALPNIQSGKTYPLTINAATDDGQIVPLYRGRLKILPTAMRVVLNWDTNDTDVDLHVRDSLGRESWYANLCGIPNGCLDHDDVNGFGPETFSLTAFQANVTYTVFLHYFSDHGHGPTTSNVKVYVDDQLVTTQNVTLGTGQFSTIGVYPQATPLLPISPEVKNLKDAGKTFNVPFYQTSDPSVIEYYLDDFPNEKLILIRKPK